MIIKLSTEKHSSYLKEVVDYQDECKEDKVVWSCNGEDWEKFFNNLFDNKEVKLVTTFQKLDGLIDIIIDGYNIQHFLHSDDKNFFIPKETKVSLDWFCEHNPRFDYKIIEKIITNKRNLKKLIALWDMTYYFFVICEENKDLKLNVIRN